MFDDKKSKVIPFAKRGICRLGMDDTGLTKASMRVLLNSVEAYDFKNETGTLQDCAEWQELCRRLKEP